MLTQVSRWVLFAIVFLGAAQFLVNAGPKVVESLVAWLADMALALVLVVVGIFGTVFVVIASFICIPVTALAVVLMFAIKSGIAVRFVGNRSDPLTASVRIAFWATALATVGSFGFLALTMQHADIRAAFFSTYGIFPEIQKHPAYASRTEEVYATYFGQLVLYVKMWGYLMLRDGLLFFGVTALLLYVQQRRSRSLIVSILSGILIWIAGVLLFAFVIYGDDLLAKLAKLDLPAFAMAVVGYVRKESQSAYELVMIPFGRSRYVTFDAWFHDELVTMSGSIFKMASIYPKLFLVFLVFSVLPYRTAPIQSAQ